jgi:hypothetical protein
LMRSLFAEIFTVGSVTVVAVAMVTLSLSFSPQGLQVQTLKPCKFYVEECGLRQFVFGKTREAYSCEKADATGREV